MRGSFRQSMAWLHTWTGLLLGWLLFFVFLTGTAGYFDTEIDRWMRPELPPVEQVAAAQAIKVAAARLQARAPQAERWVIALPDDRSEAGLHISWRAPGAGSEYLDATTGHSLAPRATGGGQLLFKMHYRLHYLPTELSYWLVGIATMFMLVAIVTGVVVHRKIFSEFFTFRWGKGQRSWLDAHNVLAVMALPFHLMITYSGLIFLAYLYMAPVVAATYGFGEPSQRTYFDEFYGPKGRVARAGVTAHLTPLAPLIAQADAQWGSGRIHRVDVWNAGDAHARVIIRRSQPDPLRSVEAMVFDGVSGALLDIIPAVRSTPKALHDVLLGLHEGLFAGPVLRWLYFLSGVVGTAMIGAGLVLWTVKRRARHTRASAASFGRSSVERLNIGTIVGLPIAIAAYFWANRLLPVALDGRAAWEAHAMFIAWAAMLLHPVFRPVPRAWIEQLWIAAAAYVLLPVLNALTTDRHLGVSLPRGDWALAGFDLTMLGFGAGFFCVAWALTIVARRTPPAGCESLLAVARNGGGTQ